MAAILYRKPNYFLVILNISGGESGGSVNPF